MNKAALRGSANVLPYYCAAFLRFAQSAVLQSGKYGEHIKRRSCHTQIQKKFLGTRSPQLKENTGAEQEFKDVIIT